MHLPKPTRDGLLLPVLTLLVGASACTEGPTAPTGPITALPRPLSSVETQVLGAANAFGFALAGELFAAEPDENLFFSPLSASMLLGMLLNGADGQTFSQMRDALAFEGLEQDEINQGYRDLIDLLVSLDPSVTVELGNSVWAREGFPVLPDFLSRVHGSFDAEAETVDFGDPATLGRINGWASDATRGHIETIFEELPSNTVMALLNAIYFEAGWTTPFDEERTEPAPFTRGDGSEVTADLMYLEGELPHGRVDGATVVELPYGGEAFAMVAVLPDEGLGMEDVLRDLTAERWNAWTGGLAEGKAVVRLPKFELDWEAELNDPLKTLGMVDAFEPGVADFGRLTPGGGPWLSLVKQKAFVSVDELGTVAAAVSGAILTDSAPLPVRFDRPFLFALRERLSGAVLFMGVVADPTE